MNSEETMIEGIAQILCEDYGIEFHTALKAARRIVRDFMAKWEADQADGDHA